MWVQNTPSFVVLVGINVQGSVLSGRHRSMTGWGHGHTMHILLLSWKALKRIGASSICHWYALHANEPKMSPLFLSILRISGELLHFTSKPWHQNGWPMFRHFFQLSFLSPMALKMLRADTAQSKPSWQPGHFCSSIGRSTILICRETDLLISSPLPGSPHWDNSGEHEQIHASISSFLDLGLLPKHSNLGKPMDCWVRRRDSHNRTIMTANQTLTIDTLCHWHHTGPCQVVKWHVDVEQTNERIGFHPQNIVSPKGPQW